jgi:hypothetical protein
MNFEEQLRRSLRRVDAPVGFAERVARLVEGRRTEGRLNEYVSPRRKTPGNNLWIAASLAASLLIAAGAGVAVVEHQRRVEALQARDMALQALRLTSAELNAIHAKVTSNAGGVAGDAEERR